MEKYNRIGIIGVVHETNSFAPGKTYLQDFYVCSDEKCYQMRYGNTRTSIGGVLDAANQYGVELAPGVFMEAIPSGLVTKETADDILESLVDSIDEEIDGLIVILHGAMVAEGYPDMEGEVLSRVRERIGNLPMAVTLDLHANISEKMVSMADMIVGYDTYPHIDIYERAVEAFELLIRQVRGEIKPTSVWLQPRMLIAPEAMQTSAGAFKEIMDYAFELEKDKRVLNIVVAGGFPFSDVSDAGIAFVVITDNDVGLAQHYAAEIADFTFQRRNKYLIHGLNAEAAVIKAEQIEQGPVILIEGSDNVGGGSPADATHTLRPLIHAKKRSLVVIKDAEAVITAHELRVGSVFKQYVGGKTDLMHGDPVWIEGTVSQLSNGKYKHIGPYMTGKPANMGRTAVIDSDNVTLILTEFRNAPWDIGHIAILGLDPEDYHIIVVKSAIAWKTAFGDIAKSEVQVDTPGCCSFNLNHFSYSHLKRPIFPFDSIQSWRS